MSKPMFEIPVRLSISFAEQKKEEPVVTKIPKLMTKVWPIVSLAALGVCNLCLGSAALALSAKKNKKSKKKCKCTCCKRKAKKKCRR